MRKAPAIGIDLGTTYSCAAVYRNGKVEIIPNEFGRRTTPSCVAFTDSEILVGDEAKEQMVLNPQNTIYDAKRLIGQSYDDINVGDNIGKWPFKIIPDSNRVKVEVDFQKKKQSFYPEQISALVLKRIKEQAEKYLEMSVEDVVITVPAYFNNAQREATKNAGRIAGLNVIRIFNEPTAASVAYGLSKKHKVSNILIYDLGGGTFDVTIFRIDDGIFDVKATYGNTHLGGQDFTNNLMRHCRDHIKFQSQNDMNESELVNLRNSCEKAKCILSTNNNTIVNTFYNGKSYSITITRSLFEDINFNFFQYTLRCVEKALCDANMSKKDIDEIVLVGGSTRIPLVKECLKKYFENKNLNMTLNADECVAFGAAVQAAIISGDESAELEDIVLLDVTSLSLGVEVRGGLMSTIIKKNTGIPTKIQKIYTNIMEDQTSVEIIVYEGEKKLCKDNKMLDKFTLNNLPKGPVESLNILVTFSVDANGILEVIAEETASGISKSCSITTTNRLSDDEIQEMIVASRHQQNEDAERKKTIHEKNNLRESYIQMLSDIKQYQSYTSSDVKKCVEEKVNDIIVWLSESDNWSTEEYEGKVGSLFEFIEQKSKTS